MVILSVVVALAVSCSQKNPDLGVRIQPQLTGVQPKFALYGPDGAGANTCTCPTWKSGNTTVQAYAGGNAQIYVTDAANGDVWRYYGGTGWFRQGGPVRSLSVGATADYVYRVSRDGHADRLASQGGVAPSDDQWVRAGMMISGNLYTGSAGGPFGILFATDPNANGSSPPLWQSMNTGNILDWNKISSGGAQYAVTGSLLYRLQTVPGTVQKYAGLAFSFPTLGSNPPSVTSIIAGAGTVFAREYNTGNLYSYESNGWTLIQFGQFVDPTRWAANDLGLYFIGPANAVTRYTPGVGISTLPAMAHADSKIVAGGNDVYNIDSATGMISKYYGGVWTNISCSTPENSPGCAAGCDPGVTPTGTFSIQHDYAWTVQNDNKKFNVLTQHNTPDRRGVAHHEDILTPAALAANPNALRLKSVPVDGIIYAQPLYVDHAAVTCGTPGGAQDVVSNKNIAYVATLGNSVYAIDVDTGAVCWKTQPLGCGQAVVSDGCGGTDPANYQAGSCMYNFDRQHENEARLPTEKIRLGIVSTPVIDEDAGVIYVVVRHRNGSDRLGRFYLDAINMRSGVLIGQAEIESTNSPTVNFEPAGTINRPGLLLLNGHVYVAFAPSSEIGAASLRGWIFDFNVSQPQAPQLVSARSTTPNKSGGGIWMGGGGIATDGTDLFYTTGNGSYASNEDDAGALVPEAPVDEEDSVVRTSTTGLTRIVRWTDSSPVQSPYNCGSRITPCNGSHTLFYAMERSDADFGSSGVVVLPGDRILFGGKLGKLYVLNKAMNYGQIFQAFFDSASTTYDVSGKDYPGPHLHGSPVFWQPDGTASTAYIYAWAEKDYLKRFRYDMASGLVLDAVNATWNNPNPTALPHATIRSHVNSMPGGLLSLSTNDEVPGSGAVIWATIEEPWGFASLIGGCPLYNYIIDPDCDIAHGYVPGRLFAFDAQTMQVLWGQQQLSSPPDCGATLPGTQCNYIPSYAKLTPPTIAHGRVLVATANNEFRIYGF